MNFSDELAAFLHAEGVTQAAALPFASLRVWNPNLLQRSLHGREEELQSVLLMVFPYYTGEYPERNLSLYALPRDYHLFAGGLFEKLTAFLLSRFPTGLFCGYADHSPIDERAAFASAGLGVLGDNGLLITEEYGSYVFLGELFSDLPMEAWGEFAAKPVDPAARGCLHCGRCQKVCPKESLHSCLSFLTQQKGELSPETAAAMKQYGTVWGCDLCQTVCPMNRGTQKTPIPFFREQIRFHLTAEQVEAMSPEEFAARAYAWRGKKTILRNLRAVEDALPARDEGIAYTKR